MFRIFVVFEKTKLGTLGLVETSKKEQVGQKRQFQLGACHKYYDKIPNRSESNLCKIRSYES